MLLYAPNGSVFPGFDSVVFAKETSEKLASVGELCDAGMVCVFVPIARRTARLMAKFLPMTREIKNQNYFLSLCFARHRGNWILKVVQMWRELSL